MKLTTRFVVLCMTLSGFLFSEDIFLAGTGSGLYRVNNTKTSLLWDKSDVRKIIRTAVGWQFLTGAGIVTSEDLFVFRESNAGLPVKVIKVTEGGKKGFVREVQELKDLEVHPSNPQILVTATKDAVYLTRNGGQSWQNMGLNSITAGAKAVSVLDLPDSTGKMQLTLLVSHPIYGVSWRQPDSTATNWVDMNAGLEKVPSIKWPDEVADISAVSRNGSVEVFASQTFMPRIYRLDWAKKQFLPVWSGTASVDTVEGLSITEKSILYTGPDTVREVSAQSTTTSAAVNDWNGSFQAVPGNLLSAWIPANRSGGRGNLSLSELWLLKPAARSGMYTQTANLKKGNYLPVHQVVTAAGYDAHLKTLKDNKLNMLVVDMKDDVGIIRYNAKDPLVLGKGNVRTGIDVEEFVRKARANGVYLVARIVVFKDKSLASWGGNRYAVWDKVENKAWQGYQTITRKIQATAAGTPAEAGAAGAIPGTNGAVVPAPAQTETVRQNYEEYWVDPYSEEVWEYNIAVAKELVSRGFDEIQFDYIRFPTDGDNLDNAAYRWKDAGMDKESALMSFLSYARREIHAPISIDIYGANGWYRTGARTGQDVELLARYVDVICPMFYPSHFEQGFLAHAPTEERPYRIYYYGSYRNTIIARNHVVVRPWAQAFYLNVSYDRAFYNPDYVQRQIFGARDSINQGYTYWNNSGRYSDLRPDIDLAAPYPWQTPEAIFKGSRPVFGGR